MTTSCKSTQKCTQATPHPNHFVFSCPTSEISRNDANVPRTQLVEPLETFLCHSRHSKNGTVTVLSWRLHKTVFWLQAQRGAVQRRYPSLTWFAPDVQPLAGGAWPGAGWGSRAQTWSTPSVIAGRGKKITVEPKNNKKTTTGRISDSTAFLADVVHLHHTWRISGSNVEEEINRGQL